MSGPGQHLGSFLEPPEGPDSIQRNILFLSAALHSFIQQLFTECPGELGKSEQMGPDFRSSGGDKETECSRSQITQTDAQGIYRLFLSHSRCDHPPGAPILLGSRDRNGGAHVKIANLWQHRAVWLRWELLEELVSFINAISSILFLSVSPGQCLSMRKGRDYQKPSRGGVEVTWRNSGSSPWPLVQNGSLVSPHLDPPGASGPMLGAAATVGCPPTPFPGHGSHLGMEELNFK